MDRENLGAESGRYRSRSPVQYAQTRQYQYQARLGVAHVPVTETRQVTRHVPVTHTEQVTHMMPVQTAHYAPPIHHVAGPSSVTVVRTKVD